MIPGSAIEVVAAIDTCSGPTASNEDLAKDLGTIVMGSTKKIKTIAGTTPDRMISEISVKGAHGRLTSLSAVCLPADVFPEYR